MSVAMPDTVRLPDPFAPALILAAPAKVTVNVPFETPTETESRLPSTSLAEIPPIVSGVSSFTVWAPGTVSAGTSLTPAICIFIFAATTPVPESFTVKSNVARGEPLASAAGV